MSFSNSLYISDLSLRFKFKVLTKSNQKILKILNINKETQETQETQTKPAKDELESTKESKTISKN